MFYSTNNNLKTFCGKEFRSFVKGGGKHAQVETGDDLNQHTSLSIQELLNQDLQRSGVHSSRGKNHCYILLLCLLSFVIF